MNTCCIRFTSVPPPTDYVFIHHDTTTQHLSMNGHGHGWKRCNLPDVDFSFDFGLSSCQRFVCTVCLWMDDGHTDSVAISRQLARFPVCRVNRT